MHTMITIPSTKLILWLLLFFVVVRHPDLFRLGAYLDFTLLLSACLLFGSVDLPGHKASDTLRGLCYRCREVDILGILSSSNLPVSCWFEPENRASTPGREHMEAALGVAYNLGEIGQVTFSTACALCRILKSCLPDLPASSPDELVIVPAWTLERTEPSIGIWWKDNFRSNPQTIEEYGRLHDLDLGKSLYVARKRPGALGTLAGGTQFSSASIRGSVTFAHHAHNALGICNTSPNAPVMSARKLAPEPNFQMLRAWIQNCAENHSATCSVTWADELRAIRLIDIQTRTVVHCPDKAEYLCLSYVWGGVKQQNMSLGSLPETLPATIEDAMKAVVKLGMRYLWVDSICIDQHNSAHKADQIGLMGLIYRGAWATIVALSGDSAESGLGRMKPGAWGTAQEVFSIGDVQVVSLLPTLQQQINASPWRRRAWTYQEGEVSRRVLYFAQQQIYFECNSMQCCESICDASPTIHTWSNQRRLFVPRFSSPQRMYSLGVFSLEDRSQGYKEPPYTENTALLRYDECIREYTSRSMSDDADALNAASALLQFIGKTYKGHFRGGFFWGLPVDDMLFALSWFHIRAPHRRCDFPSWSWTGWAGTPDRIIISTKPSDRPRSVQGLSGRPREWSGRGVDRTFFIVISRAEKHVLSPIHQANPIEDAFLNQDSWPSGKRIQNSGFPKSDIFGRSLFPQTEAPATHLLYVETIVFRPIFSQFAREPNPNAPDEEYCFRVNIAGVTCNLTCNTPRAARILCEDASEPQYLAVLHRDFEQTGWFYEMLLLEWRADVAYRIGPVKLQFPNMESRLRYEMFRALRPARARFALG